MNLQADLTLPGGKRLIGGAALTTGIFRASGDGQLPMRNGQVRRVAYEEGVTDWIEEGVAGVSLAGGFLESGIDLIG